MEQGEWIHRFFQSHNRLMDANSGKTVTKELMLELAREQVELGEAYPLIFTDSPSLVEWARRTEHYRQVAAELSRS